MKYARSWIAATSPDGPLLVPFEVAIDELNGAVTVSGPVARDVIESIELCRAALSIAVPRWGDQLGKRTHVNFPLAEVQGTGRSARLAFCLAIAACVGWTSDVTQMVAIADITLGGEVLPVGDLDAKRAALDAFAPDRIVVAAAATPSFPARKVSHLRELFDE